MAVAYYARFPLHLEAADDCSTGEDSMRAICGLAFATVLTGLAVFASTLRADGAATKDQVTAAYSGNTHYYRTSTYEWAGYYDANGKSSGKAWWSGGADTSKGKWRVTGDGLICLQWDLTKWDGGGQESCFKVTIDGDSLKTQYFSGAPAAPTGAFEIKKGNPYGL